MVSLLLLPFRGLLWLVLGLICSLPWLIILAPFSLPYWVPKALPAWVEKKTGFGCHIREADVEWTRGEITLKDVAIFNPNDFYSSDFLKFKNIHISIDLLSLLKNVVQVQTLNMDCTQFVSINQRGNHNLQLFCERIGGICSKKGYVVQKFSFNFQGLLSSRNYSQQVVSSGALCKKNFYFSNVCWNLSDVYQQTLNSTCSLEDVYNRLNSLFTYSIN